MLDQVLLLLGVASVLAAEHGEDYCEELLRLEGGVWRRIQETPQPHPDLFDGRLGELELPTLILHGAADPRTEPGELEAVLAALPHATTAILPGGGHSPHSEPAVSDEAIRAASGLLASAGAAASGLVDSGSPTTTEGDRCSDFAEDS